MQLWLCASPTHTCTHAHTPHRSVQMPPKECSRSQDHQTPQGGSWGRKEGRHGSWFYLCPFVPLGFLPLWLPTPPSFNIHPLSIQKHDSIHLRINSFPRHEVCAPSSPPFPEPGPSFLASATSARGQATHSPRRPGWAPRRLLPPGALPGAGPRRGAKVRASPRAVSRCTPKPSTPGWGTPAPPRPTPSCRGAAGLPAGAGATCWA